MIGIFTLSSVIFRPITGLLIDRFGRRPFMLAGLVVFTVMTYMYIWMTGVAMLLILRVLYGAGWAVTTTSMGTTIADVIPDARRGEGMGWYGLSMTIGMAIGPVVGLWLIQQYSFSILFGVAMCSI